VIEQVWKDFEPFARYGFNRAHAAIYGMIAYHTAYLKANYTTEYMTAVLSAEMGTPERVAIAVAECRRMGLAVLPPDVNESAFGFAITTKGIRFGLGAVKNVGQGAVEGIIEVRAQGGPFRSLDDFCGRIDLTRCNKRVLESIIKCGATDAFGSRTDQLARLDAVISTAQQEQEAKRAGQGTLFADFGSSVGLTGDATAVHTRAPSGPERKDQLSWEKELLGIYLSDHPLQEVASRMGDVVTAYLAELKEEEEQGLVIVACVVTAARKHITKEKKLMMFAQVEDLTGSVEATIFPRTYEATAAVWNTDEILLVLGRVEKRDDAPKLLVEHAVRFSDAGSAEIRRALADTQERLAKRAKFVRPAGPPPGRTDVRPAGPAAPPNPRPLELVIRFREALSYERSVEIFKRISEVLKDFSGGSAVVLELPAGASGQPRRVSTPFKANVTAEVAEAVEREVGRDLVEVVLPGR
jgi:DNA polymerase-3 subunit alpha